jgi:transposase
MQHELNNSYNIHLSQPTISRKLKKIGMTRKRLSLIPVERNSHARILERAVYSNFVSRFSDENLVFLDECGFNLHSNRDYGYSLINQKAYLNVNGNRGTNLSLLCVIDINGVVAFDIKRGAFNSESLMSFINNRLLLYFSNNNTKILIMYNVKFHHSSSVKNTLIENNINVKYLPAWSPQLNPIEEFFSMKKSRYYSVKNQFNSISDAINVVLDNDFSNECLGF